MVEAHPRPARVSRRCRNALRRGLGGDFRPSKPTRQLINFGRLRASCHPSAAHTRRATSARNGGSASTIARRITSRAASVSPRPHSLPTHASPICSCPIGRDGGRFQQFYRPVFSSRGPNGRAEMWLIVRLKTARCLGFEVDGPGGLLDRLEQVVVEIESRHLPMVTRLVELE